MQNLPPEFKQSTKCQACTSPFNFINRKHHCRNCGNTFCGKCSAKSTPIPTYGFVEPVRVCDKCYDDLRATLGFADIVPRSEREPDPIPEERTETPAAEPRPVASERQEEPEASDEKESDGAKPVAPRKKVKNCKCNMPLCVCPPDPETEEEKEERKKLEGTTKKKVVEKKPVEKPASPGKSYPAGFQSNFMGFGQKPARSYDLKADLNNQCREAVKALDVDGVRLLLKAGAKADYKDRTGNTLLHLAAMFDNTELVKLLINAGADPYAKNPDKESPIDIAPPALAMKMRQLVPAKETSSTAPSSSAPAPVSSPRSAGASTFDDEPEPDRPRPVPVAESTPAPEESD